MVRWFTHSSLLVSLYLGAIVAANLAVTHFGPWALPFTAWVLIPFDFLVRDVLHHRWESGSRLWGKMAVLVGSGSLLSFLVCQEAGRVAVASFLGFLLSGLVNAAVYAVLRQHRRFLRMNASNLFASVVDSVVFPLVAFSLFSPALSATQAGSKFIGGLSWSALFLWARQRWQAKGVAA